MIFLFGIGKKDKFKDQYSKHEEGGRTYWTLTPKDFNSYNNLFEKIEKDLSHAHGKVERAVKPAREKYQTAVALLQKLIHNGANSPEELYKLEKEADELIEKLGYTSPRKVISLKDVKKKAKKRGEQASALEEAVDTLEKVAAAILALAGVFFILAPESPTITGLTILNITNPVNTSLSMAFGIVLIATSLFFLLRKK